MTKVYARAVPETDDELIELGLVGRCFRVYESDGTLAFCGVVRGSVADGKAYLCQRHCGHCGQLADLRIFSVTDMIHARWQFFLNAQHMATWCEQHTTIEPDTDDDHEPTSKVNGNGSSTRH
jgi:hypothetical protein